jgi:hypothetical protein
LKAISAFWLVSVDLTLEVQLEVVLASQYWASNFVDQKLWQPWPPACPQPQPQEQE